MSTGMPTIAATLLVMPYLIIAKARIPPAHEVIAAADPQRLKAGWSPKSIGIEIGPTSAANHVTISPITPPKEFAFTAIIMLIAVNINVVILAALRVLLVERLWNFFERIGRMSLVTTAEMAFASDEAHCHCMSKHTSHHKANQSIRKE